MAESKSNTSSSKKPKERVNGLAAGVALLRIYEYRNTDDRDTGIAYTPIQKFLEGLLKVDRRAEHGFWLVISDYMTVVADGSVPHADYYARHLNINTEDERKVRQQLGYAN